MEGTEMTRHEVIEKYIAIYAMLETIKNAEDSNKEIDYQMKVVKVILESLGIVTETLTR